MGQKQRRQRPLEPLVCSTCSFIASGCLPVRKDQCLGNGLIIQAVFYFDNKKKTTLSNQVLIVAIKEKNYFPNKYFLNKCRQTSVGTLLCIRHGR